MNPNPESQFANSPVVMSDVPDYRGVQFESVAPTFRRYTLISTLVYSIPILPAAVIIRVVPISPPDWIILAAAGFLALVMALVAVYRWLDAGYRGWSLRDHDIIARAGVLWRAITALPIARIQHVETSHGPLERFHGLARLKLYTAGGLTADLIVIGLERDTADSLREYLVEQIRKRDAGSNQTHDE